MKKRATITMDELVPIILALVVAGLVIGAGSLVLSQFGANVQTTSSNSITSEEITLSHYYNTTAAFDYATYVTGSFGNVYVYNSTDDTLVESGNYTTSSTLGINLTTDSSYDEIGVKVNYTYNSYDNPHEYIVTMNSSQSVIEIATFIPTIAIVIAVTIIIGIIMLVSRRRGFS